MEADARLTHLKLLGAFVLHNGGGVPMPVPLKAQALAAFLALQQGRPVTREVVSELLWPDRNEKQARNSLKQELYVLRRDGFGGEEAIITRDNTLCWVPRRLVCDLDELQALMRAMPSRSWRAITGLYVAPLLHGFPPISAEFDDFLASVRRSLEADVLTALGRCADEAADAGDIETALAIAERMSRIDPLREDTHRRLITCYARLGRRVDALRVHIDAKALLRRELDVAPAAETEALIARVRDQSLAGAPSAPARLTVPAAAGDNGPPRIAVLPLRQFLDRKLASHLSDGITADIIGQLAGLRELTVISHGSTFDLRDPALDTRAVGRKLDARYLVICTLRSAGERLRLTTELTEAETSAVFPPLNDYIHPAFSFDDQDRIVAQLVNKLAPQVRETELRRIRGKRPNVLSVYEKILLSREHITLLDRGQLNEAKALLDEVIEEDPGYGEAYALAADWHNIMVKENWTSDRARNLTAIERLTQTALRHDVNNVRALVSYGHQMSSALRDKATAKQLFRRALDLTPSSAIAWALSGLCHAYAGEPAEALRQATRALELSPYDREAYKFYYALCVAHYTAGEHEQAAEWGQRALATTTIWAGTRGFTAASLMALGRLREAREITRQMQALSPNRRIGAVLNDLPYQDVGRLRRYGELLVAAGYPE